MNKIPRSVGTHDGAFHADEVTACALLVVYGLVDKDKIVRSREPDTLNRCEYVCDVGGIYDPEKKLFDHHQVDYQGQMSSAGMILFYMREQGLITEHAYNMFNQTIVLGVDKHDNGVDLGIPGVATYSHIVSNFTPIHHESTPEEQDRAFEQALEFSIGHFTRLIDRYNYILSSREAVKNAMKEQGTYLLFDKPQPWMESFFELEGESHPAQFVVMPAGSNWKLRGIPPKLTQKMSVRHPLPLEWAGLLGDELKKASGIDGAIFCHKGRFISVWETKEDALKALQIVLDKRKS
jgi:uncharacterized UPF0160 family protein